MVYEVVVGNIGTVHHGNDWRTAEHVFAEYVSQSKAGYGRAAGEPVTLFGDGEIVKEHEGESARMEGRGGGTSDLERAMDKLEAMMRGEVVVTNDKEMDLIQEMRELPSGDPIWEMRSLPNPDRVGVLDQYIAWIGGPKPPAGRFSMGDARRLNDREREQWIMNDEGLYNWWKSTRLAISKFIKENREELDRLITAALNIPPSKGPYLMGASPGRFQRGIDADLAAAIAEAEQECMEILVVMDFEDDRVTLDPKPKDELYVEAAETVLRKHGYEVVWYDDIHRKWLGSFHRP